MKRATVAIATLLVLWPGAAPAKKKRDESAKAARLLASWRFEEARELIAEISKDKPTAPVARYLRAELAFLDGDYAAAIGHIDGIDDDAFGGNVGVLRRLAASTYDVTRDFDSKKSSGGHFEIFYPPGKDEVIVDLAGDVLESAYSALHDDLGFAPSRPVRVEILSRPEDLARVSTLTAKEIETTGTIALCKYGKLMVVTPRATIFGYPWMDTLTHEYVHWVVSAMSHDEVPVWLHEGLARYLQVRWRGEADGKMSAVDEHLLASALKKNDLISFDDMHPSIAKLPSQEAAALAFAEVHTMISYLHAELGDGGLRDIIELHRAGKGARQAVAEVRGESWQDVERGWKKHLRGLKLATSPGLGGRASSRRIRFDRGGKNDENVGLDEVTSAKARKFARIAGLLRARGRTRAAVVEYEKALDLVGKGDPFVAGKLSRTYLELGKNDRAIELAEPLIELDEGDASPATTVGAARLAKGEHEDAARAFEIALRVSPFDPTVRCGLARAYESVGDARATREASACDTLRR